MGRGPTPPWFVAFARAMKAAYAERLSGLGDADPLAAETCTTHLTVCDAEGTMVAMTTTLLSSMGSRVVLPQSGVLLNNGVMWFDPRPGQPNSIAGGKRPLTNMSPIILKDGDEPWLAAGASGGRRILAAVTQMMTFLADFGMDLDTAAHQPRIDVSGPDEVSADHRLPADVIDRARGRRPDRGGRAWRAADQLRLSQRHPAPCRRHAQRHQRRRLALVRGRGAGPERGGSHQHPWRRHRTGSLR